VGGGLCQLGNLIYWMAIHSPLTIKERYRHGYDVFPDVNRSIPFGSGATLSYNYVDIQLKNETDQSFQLCFWLSDEYLHGAIRSEKPSLVRYEVYESKHQVIHQGWGGYSRHNQINRKIFDLNTNVLLFDELMAENHAIMMYEPFLTA
jgi:vancomycin resistance protein VanW